MMNGRCADARGNGLKLPAVVPIIRRAGMPSLGMHKTSTGRLRHFTAALVALLLGCGGGGETATAVSAASMGSAPGSASTAAQAANAAADTGAATTASGATTSTPPAAPTPANWQRLGTIAGLCCSYTPLAVAHGAVQVFSNARSATADGEFYAYQGTLAAGVRSPQRLLAAAQITDVPAASYKVRTAGVRHHPALGWVAVLRVGAGYPSADGYVPALATSADGQNWVYRGKLAIDGQVWPAHSDSSALVLQADKPAVLNLQQPFENRYLIFENNISLPEGQRKLVLAFSADGVDWRFHRDAATGHVVEMWPPDAALAADKPLFATADAVNGSIHLLVADAWHDGAAPTRAHRHLCVPAGSQALRYLGDATTWRSGAKGPHIAYDEATDTLWAISQAVGYKLAAASRVCGP
jgi:hypothetical protein